MAARLIGATTRLFCLSIFCQMCAHRDRHGLADGTGCHEERGMLTTLVSGFKMTRAGSHDLRRQAIDERDLVAACRCGTHMFVCIYALNVVGDALRDALDPKLLGNAHLRDFHDRYPQRNPSGLEQFAQLNDIIADMNTLVTGMETEFYRVAIFGSAYQENSAQYAQVYDGAAPGGWALTSSGGRA